MISNVLSLYCIAVGFVLGGVDHADFPGAIWHSTLKYLDITTSSGKHHRDSHIARITELDRLSSIPTDASLSSCKRHEGANTSASGEFLRDGNYINRTQTRHDDLLPGIVARKG